MSEQDRLPIVAVVGRPNVGKSTLVNRLARTDDAIVHARAGVTRDRSYAPCEWNGRYFVLVDTGGIEISSTDQFQLGIKAQAQMAIEEADLILLLVDGRGDVTSEDEQVARLIKRAKKPVILVVNKVDTPGSLAETYAFYQMGLGEPIPVSATHGNGTGDLLDLVVGALPQSAGAPPADDSIKVALLGRPNAGKSSLLNRLVGRERSMVSDVAGTTRDTIDTQITYKDRLYTLIDTAGLRRKGLITDDVEYYGFVRAMRALERADVAVLLIDASVGLTDQDQRIANFAISRGCALVVAVNKWDLMRGEEEQREELLGRLEDRLTFAAWAPRVRLSALTGRGVELVLDTVKAAYDSAQQQISTSALNRLLTELRDFGHTVSHQGKTLRLNYVTQTHTGPPGFTFFCNFPQLADESFERYLENRLRERFDLTGTPITLKFKKKGE
ncbi:MAG: ribosome biogenesis GTPase Der [Coriobacteriia bacterium]|nr:ribosome biogenesis GTPase Der [Coriobacteriia bacterium]